MDKRRWKISKVKEIEWNKICVTKCPIFCSSPAVKAEERPPSAGKNIRKLDTSFVMSFSAHNQVKICSMGTTERENANYMVKGYQRRRGTRQHHRGHCRCRSFRRFRFSRRWD